MKVYIVVVILHEKNHAERLTMDGNPSLFGKCAALDFILLYDESSVDLKQQFRPADICYDTN
jgi:hypothetical protein